MKHTSSKEKKKSMVGNVCEDYYITSSVVVVVRKEYTHHLNIFQLLMQTCVYIAKTLWP